MTKIKIHIIYSDAPWLDRDIEVEPKPLPDGVLDGDVFILSPDLCPADYYAHFAYMRQRRVCD